MDNQSVARRDAVEKHTPGPWKITDVWSPGWRIAATVGNDSEDVAQITTLANARLIAAAPEMLELLRDSGMLDGERGDQFAERARALLARIGEPGEPRPKGIEGAA